MNMKKLVAAAALALMVVGTQAGAETLRVESVRNFVSMG